MLSPCWTLIFFFFREDTNDQADPRAWGDPIKLTVRRDSRKGSQDHRLYEGHHRRLSSSEAHGSRLAHDNLENHAPAVDGEDQDRLSGVGDKSVIVGARCANVGDTRGNVGEKRSVGEGHGSRMDSVGDGNGHDSRMGSVGTSMGDSRFISESRDSDSSSNEQVSVGRTRRPRKAVTYKEKPLNRYVAYIFL